MVEGSGQDTAGIQSQSAAGLREAEAVDKCKGICWTTLELGQVALYSTQAVS
jgi:hypothetical protein